jgi:hypothetical protein
MPTSTFAFAGGVAPTEAIGQKTKIRFGGTWVGPVAGSGSAEFWTLQFTSTLTGDFTVGKGNIAGAGPTCALKLRDRMYIGVGEAFCLSSVEDVTKWEEQDAGAARISYVSQFGPQDEVIALSTVQGRLAVFGVQSIQIWSVDADPSNLALQQTLDNSGARATQSVKSIGDLDVLYLDSSGVRSLRSKESTLNAFVGDDIGTAIDLLIRAALVGYDATQACAVVEPTTKQYWLYLNGNIYVLSNYPASKIIAWSIFKPTSAVAITPSLGDYTTVVGGIYYWTKAGGGVSLTCGSTVLTATGGFVATATVATEVGTTGTLVRVDTAFVPEKFVVHSRQVYVRATNGKIFRYGGSDNNTYDACRATIETSFLNLKEPDQFKQATGIGVAIAGNWKVEAGMDPLASNLTTIIDRGSMSSPSIVSDSTFDIGFVGFSAHGTHFKIKATSGVVPTAAKLCEVVLKFEKAERH